jgi:hypothetical protein
MAFQTSAYANALAESRLSESDIREMEARLYPWMQQLHSLRITHVDNAAQASLINNGARAVRETWEKVRSHSGKEAPARRGIVITAGNKQFKYTSQLISTIRHGLNNSIPIEVYYYGREDLRRDRREFLQKTFDNVRTIDLSSVLYFNESFVRLQDGAWAMKPFAMMATNFTEVMLLDADSVVLADPDDFFLEPGYKATGTLFFHDRLVPNWQYENLHIFLREQIGERGPSRLLGESVFWRDVLRHRQESGLVVLDKSRPAVFASLLFTLWQNAGPIRDAITYSIFYGDKETFWLPFELAGLPYHFSRYWAGAIGPEHAAHSEGFCSDHILHFFEAPYATAPLHENGSHQEAWKRGRPAWINGSLRNNKLWDPDEGVMDWQKAIWTMDGRWDWRPLPDTDGSTCCMVDYTRWSMRDLNLGDALPGIFEAGKKALRLLEEFDDEQ